MSLLVFIVNARIIVNIALAVHAATEVSQTPFNFHNGVRAKRNAIENTSVPKNDVINERTGLSRAVK